MRHIYYNFLLAMLVWFSSGCAVMYHTQVGEVDSRIVQEGRRFELLVNEVGVNFNEAGEIGKSMARNQDARNAIASIQAIIALFQMGPRTGNQVFSPEYADSLFSQLQKECPSGRVSGLVSVREMAKYPVVSGEIVKIIGYCKEG